MRIPLSLNGIKTHEDGFIAESDLLDRFGEAVDAFDLLIDEYADMEEAA